jgi:hypothetical protein
MKAENGTIAVGTSPHGFAIVLATECMARIFNNTNTMATTEFSKGLHVTTLPSEMHDNQDIRQTIVFFRRV